MLPIWENIYTYLEIVVEEQSEKITKLKEIDESLITFFNQEINYQELSTKKLNQIAGKEERIIKDISSSVVLCQGLTIDSFMDLLKSIPYSYNSLSCNNLSPEKIDYMIYSGVLNPTFTNFEYLKKYFPPNHIKLIELRRILFISSLEKFTIDSNDALSILESKFFTKEQKVIVIKSLNKGVIENKKELSNSICEILSTSIYIELPLEFIEAIFKSGTSNNNRIKLFNLQLEKRRMDHNLITSLLLAMGNPFSRISQNGQRPKIINSKENQAFAEHLELKEYISTYNVKGDYIKINTKRK
jgi:hypothetical protein